MDRDKKIEEFANVYANCRNGKQVGVNFTEWQRSFDGCIEGAKWADANPCDTNENTSHKDVTQGLCNETAPPFPADKSIVEEFSEERLNDILSPDLVSRRVYVDALNKITALEALAKQMAEALEISLKFFEQVESQTVFNGIKITEAVKCREALDAYKRGVGKV